LFLPFQRPDWPSRAEKHHIIFVLHIHHGAAGSDETV
jgi:hypothetical protein